jgi:hypothetical protein
MEDEKLERLHAALSKLAPRGKVGGLGYSSKLSTRKFVDPSLPDNPLYRNFVRAGSCIGIYHKRFDETKDDGNADEGVGIRKDKKRKKDKKKKDKKKDKKEDGERYDVFTEQVET